MISIAGFKDVLILGYFAITLHSPNSKWNYVVSRSETIGLVTNMDSMHTYAGSHRSQQQ
jgi:hypothetical protein